VRAGLVAQERTGRISRCSRWPSCADADQVRDSSQPEDREGSWDRNPADAARPRRRGDRM